MLISYNKNETVALELHSTGVIYFIITQTALNEIFNVCSVTHAFSNVSVVDFPTLFHGRLQQTTSYNDDKERAQTHNTCLMPADTQRQQTYTYKSTTIIIQRILNLQHICRVYTQLVCLCACLCVYCVSATRE